MFNRSIPISSKSRQSEQFWQPLKKVIIVIIYGFPIGMLLLIHIVYLLVALLLFKIRQWHEVVSFTICIRLLIFYQILQWLLSSVWRINSSLLLYLLMRLIVFWGSDVVLIMKPWLTWKQSSWRCGMVLPLTVSISTF